MQAVHFITFYVPLWGAILYNGFTYFQVIRMLNNATRVRSQSSVSIFINFSWYDSMQLFKAMCALFLEILDGRRHVRSCIPIRFEDRHEGNFLASEHMVHFKVKRYDAYESNEVLLLLFL